MILPLSICDITSRVENGPRSSLSLALSQRSLSSMAAIAPEVLSLGREPDAEGLAATGLGAAARVGGGAGGALGGAGGAGLGGAAAGGAGVGGRFAAAALGAVGLAEAGLAT